MSPISSTQQGIIAQQEFAMLVVLGSDGQLEVARSLTDNERREVEVHAQGQLGQGLAFQVKSTTYLEYRFRARHLAMSEGESFSPLRRPVGEAELPLRGNQAGLHHPSSIRVPCADAVFLVPSAEVHAQAAPHENGDTWTFNFSASLAPASRDRWRRCRVEPTGLGKRVLQILTGHRARKKALGLSGALTLPEGALWVSRH